MDQMSMCQVPSFAFGDGMPLSMAQDKELLIHVADLAHMLDCPDYGLFVFHLKMDQMSSCQVPLFVFGDGVSRSLAQDRIAHLCS